MEREIKKQKVFVYNSSYAWARHHVCCMQAALIKLFYPYFRSIQIDFNSTSSQSTWQAEFLPGKHLKTNIDYAATFTVNSRLWSREQTSKVKQPSTETRIKGAEHTEITEGKFYCHL